MEPCEATRLNVAVNDIHRGLTEDAALAQAHSLDTFDQQLADKFSHILPPDKLSAFMDAQLAQGNAH